MTALPTIQQMIKTSFSDAPFLVVGHRGAAGTVPENTLPSFAEAAAMGAHAIELDIYAIEETLVVIHDATLQRTTNGHGRVQNQSLEGLRRLDAGNGAQIPLLSEVLAWLPDTLALNIELKGPGTGVVLARIAATLPSDRLLVSSFDHQELRAFTRAKKVPVQVAPLFDRWSAGWQATAKDFATCWVNFNQKLLSEARCAELRSAGMQVLAYTVNEPYRARQLAAFGVRGIFTDYPERMMTVAD